MKFIIYTVDVMRQTNARSEMRMDGHSWLQDGKGQKRGELSARATCKISLRPFMFVDVMTCTFKSHSGRSNIWSLLYAVIRSVKNDTRESVEGHRDPIVLCVCVLWAKQKAKTAS